MVVAKQQHQPARKGISTRDLTSRHDQVSSVVYLILYYPSYVPIRASASSSSLLFSTISEHNCTALPSHPQSPKYTYLTSHPLLSPLFPQASPSAEKHNAITTTRLDSPRSRQHSTIIPDAQLARMPEPAILRKRQPEDFRAFRTLQKS